VRSGTAFYGWRHHPTLFVSELKTLYYLAIPELAQIVAIDHLWKVCLISLTEIDELTN